MCMSRAEKRERKKHHYISVLRNNFPGHWHISGRQQINVCCSRFDFLLDQPTASDHCQSCLTMQQQDCREYFSLCREVCEVSMSHETLNCRFGGPGVEVEADETYLTCHKYHKGRRMRSQTITVLGIYERDTKLGVHLQVKDKSSVVLLSEISQFIEPGSQIISDAMAS